MRLPFKSLFPVLVIGLATLGCAAAQDIGMNPTRPTIANSASIQNKGVLQFEIGYDAFPQRVPGDQQTAAANLSYAALNRLRLDFGWSPFTHQQNGNSSDNGVSTITLGGKIEIIKEQLHHPAPGFAIQYEAEFPTASEHPLQNYGQQITLFLSHHYFGNGMLGVIANGSLVQANCQKPTGCTYGGQQSFALSFRVQKNLRLYSEIYSQNNSESNTPPGTYVLGGFYHQFGNNFGIDGGMRFGVTAHSSSVGTTIGLIYGRRAHGR